MKEYNLNEKNAGITLIALVVTVVVLLILAGISISMLTGENGILNRASEAKEKTKLGQEDENKILQGYEDIMNQYTGKLPSREETKPYFPNSTFSYKEGDLSSGLVIKDIDGNEYVWVEVPTTIYKDSKYNKNGEPSDADNWEKIRDCLKAYTVDYSNSDYKDTNTDGTTYSDDYKNMLKSVYTNGGFWIGRYEAGLEGNTPRKNEANIIESDKAVTKPNMYPYNYVTRDDAQTLSERMNYNGVTSSLIYGVQWDLILKYIENKNTTQKDNLTLNSETIGNYNNNLWNITNVKAKYSTDYGNSFIACPYKKNVNEAVLLTTGADGSFSLMNMYDIAGNVNEWTREFYNTSCPCVDRGGSYDTDSLERSAKYHSNGDSSDSSCRVGFRIGLWK